MDVWVTQSIGESHPLNYIPAQEKNCKQIGNERWWVAKTSRRRASNEPVTRPPNISSIKESVVLLFFL